MALENVLVHVLHSTYGGANLDVYVTVLLRQQIRTVRNHVAAIKTVRVMAS